MLKHRQAGRCATGTEGEGSLGSLWRGQSAVLPLWSAPVSSSVLGSLLSEASVAADTPALPVQGLATLQHYSGWVKMLE